MANKLFISLSISFLLLLNNPSVSYAVTPPEFPSCLNPQGEVKASYDEGVHGIVGSNQTYTGSDDVYSLSDGRLMQCLCTDDGDGIQTNWWKISSLTESEIQVLKNQGWFYIPNGSLWGLEEAEYMAKNEIYSCRSDNGGNGDDNGDDDHGDNGDDNNGSVGGTSDSKSSGGSVLGTSTDAFGLASTGNMRFIISVFAIGIISLLTGISIKKSLS